MHPSVPELRTLVERIQAEYREMPGLSLTCAQARRVWHLDESRCQAVFAVLLNTKFLTRTRRGAFVRTGQDA